MKRSLIRGEEGSVLIQVGVGLIVLIAFSMFTFDYGVMWVSRRQAQNAADAGALAGAVALAFDQGAFDDDALKARQSALVVASAHNVWGEAPSADDNTLQTTYPVTCPDGTVTCLRVDVYRNTARGNPLPMFFGQLMGLSTQGVRATASGQAMVADASDCLKPFGIPDRWEDRHDESAPVDEDWTMGDEFETHYTKGPNKGEPLPIPDHYRAPTKSDPGTGFTLARDYGRQMTLKFGNPSDTAAPGNFMPIALPTWDGESTGGSDYEANISGCNGVPIKVGTTITTEPGAMVGPTAHGMDDLIDLDPSATWNESAKRVENSCAQATTPCAAVSPRIVAIPVFDTGAFHAGQMNGRTEIRIVNILGFFMERMDGNDVVGRFVNIPGLKIGSSSNISPEAAFMKVPLLVR